MIFDLIVISAFVLVGVYAAVDFYHFRLALRQTRLSLSIAGVRSRVYRDEHFAPARTYVMMAEHDHYEAQKAFVAGNYRAMRTALISGESHVQQAREEMAATSRAPF